MKLFRTVLSTVLTVVMAATILPLTGKDIKAAEKNQLYIYGIKVTDTNKDDILGDGSLKYDPVSSTLTFVTPHDVIEKTDSYAPISFSGDTLTIRGTGSFISEKHFGMIMIGNLVIPEGSDITIKGKESGYMNLGGDLTVNGKLALIQSDQSEDEGVAGLVSGKITVEGTNASLTGFGYNGIACEKAFSINSGYFYVEAKEVGAFGNYFHLGDGMSLTLPSDGKFGHEEKAEYIAKSDGKTFATIIEIKAVSNPTPAYNYDTEGDGTFADFIERLYNVALGRESEAEGKKFWVDTVTSGSNTGADCARGFLMSAEFLNKGLSREQFLDVLYRTFFKREADSDGKAYWMDELNNGMSMETVINNFINSREWCDICAAYGVRSGAPTAKATIASANSKEFAKRLYTECLGRDAEEDGLKFWSLSLTNQEVSGYEAAKQFFTSAEFKEKNYDNTEFVKRCYKTFMGRDYDEAGLNYWVNLLNNGTEREEVLKGFAQSKEYTDICNTYGITRGI
ncbi:MAG: DUF4214 domain-containing protein [Clostridiales bacterium]|nr:DUF4214 domain-containing protein [Clostridiales bacterium]